MPSKAEHIKNIVNKYLGDDTIRLASDPRLVVSYLPTGVLPIDVMLGGGLPRGRFTEIYGNYSTLKSYIALRAIAETQASGGVAALIDTEHAFDPVWAEAVGVYVDDLMLSHPPTGEVAVDATELFVRQGVDLIVWDSVAATLPRDEQEKSMSKDKQQPARLAALMSAALRKINAANKTGVEGSALLCVNQTREKVGVMWGSPESVPGGRSLPFYASYRIALRKSGQVTERTQVFDGEKKKSSTRATHQKIKATLEKSKLSDPNGEVWFLWDFGEERIDEHGFLINYCIEHGILYKEGKSWKVDGLTPSVPLTSEEKVQAWVRTKPKVHAFLRSKVLAGSPTVAK